MKASETSLRNLLEGTKQFQIPLFQRPYAWEKKNWETLWEDLMSLYTGEVEGSYFLGSIVTQAISATADGISPFTVIDGQQRLITLTILLATLRHYFVKQKKTQLADEIYNLYLINQYKKNEDVYKVLPTQDDREVYKSIIESKKAKELKKEGKIYEAYNFFADLIKKTTSDSNICLDCDKLKTIVLERLILINITSDNKDNPYLIFESLNNKGQELTQADLVRNYIFMHLPFEKREEIYQSKWLPLEKQFKVGVEEKNKKDRYSEKLTEAVWFFLRKDGSAVSEKEVYRTIKNRFEHSGKDVQDKLDKLEELVRFVNYYRYLYFYEREQEQRLSKRFKRLIRLDFTTCHIFLLNIYNDYENKRLSIENFEKILIYLESYFVRRLFAGISTKSLGIIFNSLYKEVKEKNPNDLVNGLEVILIGYEGTKTWPKDDDFRKGIIDKAVYSNSSINKIKLILESLEELFNKEKVDYTNINIEHIMPQKLTQQWEKHYY